MAEELKLFEGQRIRHIYDEEKETYYFSVVDIVAILIEKDYQSARKYWNKLAQRLRDEGSVQTVTNCHQLKMQADDGKMRKTDVADIKTIFRIIQSVPSKKAEPIKQWLAKVGQERVQEMADPTTAIDRARETYKKLGRSDKWIQQRMTGQETRNKLTDYWKDHEISEGEEYAILTNIIHQEWSGLSVKEHKNIKGLKSQNLRDHMSEAELIFTALAELSTRQGRVHRFDAPLIIQYPNFQYCQNHTNLYRNNPILQIYGMMNIHNPLHNLYNYVLSDYNEYNPNVYANPRYFL